MTGDVLELLRGLRDETLRIVESEWSVTRANMTGDFEDLAGLVARVDVMLGDTQVYDWPVPASVRDIPVHIVSPD